MADDGQEDEVAASLARLRMFLAPHKPSNSALIHDPQPSEVPSTGDECGSAELNGARDNDQSDSNDDLSSDLSTLAEQLSSAADMNDTEEASEPCESSTKAEAEVGPSDDRPPFDEPEVPVPATSAVATVSPISSLSKEYSRVKYLLQCSLPGFRVHDDMVMWDMKNPVLAAQYEAHTNGLLELESWVDVDKLSAAMGDSRSNDTASSSSDVHDNEKTFTTGSIAVDIAGSKKGRKQLVLCKIGVGRSLAIDSENDAKSTPLPPGYHSYYVHTTIEGSDRCYRHEYILNDALQILPQYLVRFSYSAVEIKALHQCALCEKQPASLVCKACDAELCPDCDQEVHSANKLVERHKRTALREQNETSKSRHQSSGETNQPTSNGQITEEEVNAIVCKQVEDSMNDFQATCPFHTGKKIEFYCPICAIPVCVTCKMVGDHSIGDKGSHRLHSITDAYERSLRDSFKSDPLVDSRRSVIENKLSLISQWEKDIERNREQVEAAIKKECEQALARLDEEVRKKTCVLKGESLEFVRQLQQIQWLDDCLDERRSSCSVVEFLSTWNQHKLLRAEQRDFPVSLHTSLAGDQVKADLQLMGHLQVVSGDHVLPRLSLNGSDFGDLSLQDDRCGPLSPRSSIGGFSSPPTSVRRTSDNEIRRKLLSMRSVEKRQQGTTTTTASPSKALAGMSTLSPEGQNMMEEIRSDLFARRTVRSSSGSLSPALGSPTATSSSPSGATMRMFSIQPVRGLHMGSTISAPTKLRPTTAAWTALLRRELAASKESSPVETTEFPNYKALRVGAKPTTTPTTKMARDRDRRPRDADARPSGGSRGRSARGGARQPRGGRAGQQGAAAASSGRRNQPNPQGKATPSRAARHRKRVPDWMHLLPDDIVAQSLLPFLVWHDTSALGCGSRALARVVRRARGGHPQWETHAFGGDSARACLGAMAAQLGRGANGALRFAPTLALATLAFANAQDARDAQTVWGELVDTVVARDVLPVGCVLVGMLDGRIIGDNGEPVRRGEDGAAVVLTVSVGHLPNTVVDTAAFDRKALRWSASGLTEELECPFKQDDARRDEQQRTSLLVWSTSAKPAQVLLSLASRWFPGALVGGGVLARADHAPSLMTFCRSRDAPRRSKVLAQRKMKAATHAPVGVLSCPSTLLIRLRGNAFIRPLGLCLDRPLTPILKNEALTATEDVELARQDIRSYGSVSILDERLGDVDTHHMGEIITHFMQHDHAPGGIVNFYASTTVNALRRAILPDRQDKVAGSNPPVEALKESIRSISLYVDRRGMLTVRDHWEVGEYGVVTVRRNAEELVTSIEEQMHAQLLDVHQGSSTPLAAVVFCSTEIDDGSSSRILESIRRSLNRISSHELVVDGEIGPIVMPGVAANSPFQLQTGTISGFMVSYSS